MVLHRLRCFWIANPEEVITQWDKYFPEIALSINTRDMKRFGFSPFELMYGRKYASKKQGPLVSALVKVRMDELNGMAEKEWENDGSTLANNTGA